MKLMDNKEKKFSIEDFEKGLMLAGYICPASITELSERQQLEEYEKELEKEKKGKYFKKVVLAAEIAAQLYKEPTFGHVKFVKLLYLAENVCKMSLNTNYGRYAAGPLDPKLLYSIDSEFKKQKWFNVSKSEYGYKYEPAENIDRYKVYFLNYFKNENEDIQHLIDLLRDKKTDFCEIVATLFHVWSDLKISNALVNNSALISGFYNWDKAKKRFDEEKLVEAIEWMSSNNIYPCF